METSCISDSMSKPFKYYILNKPFACLSQFTKEESEHPCLADLNLGLARDVYPIGRLDAESEGLLLLSNDKYLVNKLLEPKHEHKRTYYAQVEGAPTPENLKTLETGIDLNIRGKIFTTLPAKLQILEQVDIPDRNPPIRVRKEIPDTWVEISLTEGKYHQVRKMFASIGFPVLRLIRVSIENIKLGNLKEGQLLEINPFVAYRKLNIKPRTSRT